MAIDFLNNTNQILTGGLPNANSSPASSFALGGATFKTQQATVDLTRQVRYSLVNTAIPASNTASGDVVPRSLTFPVSPQSMLISRTSLVNWFETQGSNAKNSTTVGNVMRIVDLYGITPAVFNIRGTTGYNKYYVDNFQKTGTQWTATLQKFILRYFQDLQNNPGQPDDLQFLDYWYGQYWHVVPAGPVRISQDAARPLWMFYDLTLIGLSELSASQITESQSVVKDSLPSAKSNMATLQQTMAAIITGAALLGPLF